MKLNNTPRYFIVLGCVAVSAIGLLTPSLTLAEGKGAAKLMFGAPAAQPQLQAAAPSRSEMACPRCTDGYTKVTDTSAKGMRAGSTQIVPSHLCASCETKIVSVGAGKAKADKVTHSCGNTATAQASCCMAVK